jgi:hypothetical protein
VLPALRTPITLHTSDGPRLAGELAPPAEDWLIRQEGADGHGRIRPVIGHVYGYRLEPAGDQGTLVTSYYDWSSESRRGDPGLQAGEETPRHLRGNVGGIR